MSICSISFQCWYLEPRYTLLIISLVVCRLVPVSVCLPTSVVRLYRITWVIWGVISWALASVFTSWNTGCELSVYLNLMCSPENLVIVASCKRLYLTTTHLCILFIVVRTYSYFVCVGYHGISSDIPRHVYSTIDHTWLLHNTVRMYTGPCISTLYSTLTGLHYYMLVIIVFMYLHWSD